jgi:hypothetical protein
LEHAQPRWTIPRTANRWRACSSWSLHSSYGDLKDRLELFGQFEVTVVVRSWRSVVTKNEPPKCW